MRPLMFALAVAIAAPLTVSAAFAQAPAAVAASPADVAGARAFIDKLSQETFAVLRDKSKSKPAMKTTFRAMLKDNVALDDVGARLIRRHRAQATPEQLAAYQAALPEFIVNAYSDRLAEYSNATIKVVRAAPRGARGDVDVFTRIAPASGQPFDATWSVRKSGERFLLTNLTVSGINVALTQEADFSSYIQRNGFDALVAFMKSSNGKSAA